MFTTRHHRRLASFVAAGIALLVASSAGWAQSVGYQPRSNAAGPVLSYSSPDPAPRMMRPSEAMVYPTSSLTPDQRYRPGRTNELLASRRDLRGMRFADRLHHEQLPTPASPEPIQAGPPDGYPYQDDYHASESMPADEYGDGGPGDDWYAPEPCEDDAPDDHAFLRCLWDKLCPCSYLHQRVPQCYLFSPKMWQNFNEFGGVQAFKGPVDLGTNGNFGFHKGINWAQPFCNKLGIGYQLGATIALSDLEGQNAPFHTRRDQYFVTGGLFRRANCNRGLQGGAVLDYLHDEYYVDMNLLQVRSEISYLWSKHELGVWAAAHTRSDTQDAPAFLNTPTVTWQTNDQYNLFYRRRFCNGGVGRTWIGLSAHGDVLFGSDATAPLSERWAIQASYNYLLPRSDPNEPNFIKESWNLSIDLVWYPGYKVPNACFNPYRPLFTVADNGSMMILNK